MNNSTSVFPKPGSKITYAEAFEIYEKLEHYLLAKVYDPAFANNVRAYDLMWHLESVASKHEVADSRPFRSLRDLMCRFSVDRTALANGINGKRFYMLNDPQALAKHDKTHLFEILVDGERLRAEFDSFLELLSRESLGKDDYADTYSPDWPSREKPSTIKPGDRSARTMITCLALVETVLAACLIAHATFALIAYSTLL